MAESASPSPAFELSFTHHSALEDGQRSAAAIHSLSHPLHTSPHSPLAASCASPALIPCCPSLLCGGAAVVSVLSMLLGVWLLLLGSRWPRLSSFCIAWLCGGVLLYFVLSVCGVPTAVSVAVAFVVPLVALAPPIGLLPPLARSLLAALVCFICWLGFHTAFPSALSSNPVGLYLLLALPAAVFAAVGLAVGTAVTFVVCCPIVGVFLMYQGVTTFIHEQWPLLYALDQRPTCQDASRCYIAFAVALLAAAAGVALQAFLTSSQLRRAAADAAGDGVDGDGKELEPTAVLSGKFAIPMTVLGGGSASGVTAAGVGGAAAGGAGVDSAVVPLYSLADIHELPEDGHAAVVVTISPSPVSSAGQHVVVLDAPPAVFLSYPTAPVPLLLPHPPSTAALQQLHLGLSPVPPGAQRWGTDPLAGGRGSGAQAKQPGQRGKEEAEEEEEEGHMPTAEEGGRRWGSHVSVDSRRGATPHTPAWVAVYDSQTMRPRDYVFDYEEPDDDQLRATASQAALAQPIRSDSGRSGADGDDGEQRVEAADSVIDGDGGRQPNALYLTMQNPVAFNVRYSATLSEEPMQLTVHEADASRSGPSDVASRVS